VPGNQTSTGGTRTVCPLAEPARIVTAVNVIADYVLARPRKKGDSLLVNCLADGLSAAEKAIQADNDDLAEQKAFISRVSEELVHCLALTLMIKNKGVWSVYDPNTQGYLDEIIRSSISEELNWVNKTPRRFREPEE
jgi:hypothetical protein